MIITFSFLVQFSASEFEMTVICKKKILTGVKRMVLQSGSCQNYTALFVCLFKRCQELVGYLEAGRCQFFDRNEQISMVHIKRLWCQGTREVRVGDFLPSLLTHST